MSTARQLASALSSQSATVQRRGHLATLIEWIFTDSDQTNGHRRIRAAVSRQGERLTPELVRSIMREQRFAVDRVRFDLSANPLVELQTGFVATSRGDPARNENYLACNQPLLAVADATVTAVVCDVPDQPPHVFPTGLRLHQYGGNYFDLKKSESLDQGGDGERTGGC